MLRDGRVRRFAFGASLDITADQVVIDFRTTSQFVFVAFNGFALTDAFGAIDALNGVTIDAAANMVGPDASRISFTADRLRVNWQGLSVSPSTLLVLNLDFGGRTVPEPSTLALVALALTGSALARRRA